MSEKKLVVLGVPWDVDTDGLRDYMSKFGKLEDCIVMKCYAGKSNAELTVISGTSGEERSSGRSRGFGYVTFATVEDAKNALSSEHFLGNRILEVKVATPKEEMRAPSKKVTRIFVARIPPSVTDEAFRSKFFIAPKKMESKFFDCEVCYVLGMYTILIAVSGISYCRIQVPKGIVELGSSLMQMLTVTCLLYPLSLAESVDNLMAETHELGGSTVVVDRATPKEDDFRPISRMPQGGYGAYNAYITAATRYAALGAPTLYDHPGAMYGSKFFSACSLECTTGECLTFCVSFVLGRESARGMSKKIFVGRLPQEATTDDLRQHFGRFGRIFDVYIPKDPKRTGHRGFGFVTFAEDGVAERVSRRSHEICGQQVAIDTATPPVDDAGPSSGNFAMDDAEPYGGYSGGPMRGYGRIYGSLDYDNWSYGMGGGRPSRADLRYRPY
ncbi:hypothetical protein RHMOL_Rhmol08G0116200 [Rhododendron molle]|uniref:Uncharacterized protein n=2 Tax=Rhododendron molle TaxID=49168 RepID=A0ACC0MPC0_RHOML|nr:hypothetical protein RHMOL_Rhmol08G0116200 [Rhododendron molle]KAI8542145.1 hypothetical protein RHMOL_Rhmol08G0116200 [Rhododendron molle]